MAIQWLHDIPPEIRFSIYEMLFKSLDLIVHNGRNCVQDCRTRSDRNTPTNLFLTCKAVKHEAEPIYMSKTNFRTSRCVNGSVNKFGFVKTSGMPPALTLDLQLYHVWDYPQLDYWLSSYGIRKIAITHSIRPDMKFGFMLMLLYSLTPPQAEIAARFGHKLEPVRRFLDHLNGRVKTIELKIQHEDTPRPCTVTISSIKEGTYHALVDNYYDEDFELIKKDLKRMGISKGMMAFKKSYSGPAGSDADST
ncbi:hypothetical protein PMZ80_010418 [Knufia obscura]|uniref:Uncharacterized protein n=1 Tax=Knufia obscura TaxID=1635080 RepID=A0ABR0R9U7_9EURO|nr:hypothetical protein PMZ80_010418 [Knufia obscura]